MSNMSNKKIGKLVCLTGFSGSGKSTALKILNNIGYKTFNVDEWVHEIYKKDKKGYKLIKKLFGNDFLINNEVNRVKLKQEIFTKEHQRNKLEKNINSLIFKKLTNLKQQNKLIFVELATLIYFFDYFFSIFNQVIVINNPLLNQKEDIFRKKSPVEKFSTKTVGNPCFIDKNGVFYVDFIVENLLEEEKLKNELKKILLFI